MSAHGRGRARPAIAVAFVCASATSACGPKARPVEEPTTTTAVATAATDKPGSPSIEYDLGPVDPATFKSKVASLKSAWNDCFFEVHKQHAFIEGKLTFTLRTRKDGTVKWAYVKQSDLGSRAIEKCVVDSIKAQNYGPPMDAKEGEVAGHTYGWAIDEDDRSADPGQLGNVEPFLAKAKGRFDGCRHGGKGRMTATIYVDKGGKPISAGVAVDDPSLEGAVDCAVDVIMGLKFVNKASWPTKTVVTLP